MRIKDLEEQIEQQLSQLMSAREASLQDIHEETQRLRDQFEEASAGYRLFVCFDHIVRENRQIITAKKTTLGLFKWSRNMTR